MCAKILRRLPSVSPTVIGGFDLWTLRGRVRGEEEEQAWINSRASSSWYWPSAALIMATLLEYTQVELLTLSGPEFRRVSTAPPRPPTEDEIPIIDLASIDKGLEARKTIASKVRAAAESTGFFYIKNHGISEELIQNALSQAKAFFSQPIEKKQRASSKIQSNTDGWHGLGTTQINKSETRGKHHQPHLSR